MMNHSGPAYLSSRADSRLQPPSHPACSQSPTLPPLSSTGAGLQLAAAAAAGGGRLCVQECSLPPTEAMIVGIAPGGHSPVLSLTEEEMMEEDHEIVVASSSPVLHHHHQHQQQHHQHQQQQQQQLRFLPDEPCAQYSLRTSPSSLDQLQAHQVAGGSMPLSSGNNNSSSSNTHISDMQVFPPCSTSYSGSTPDHLSPVQQANTGGSPVAGRFSPAHNSQSDGSPSLPSGYHSAGLSLQSSHPLPPPPHRSAPVSSRTMGGPALDSVSTISMGMVTGGPCTVSLHDQLPPAAVTRSDVDMISRSQDGGVTLPQQQQQQQPSPVTTSAPPYKPIYNHLDSDGISVSLEGRELWDEFYKRGTEMIVNRAGRRMFPGFAVNVSGLKPKCKYTMRMEIVLADKHRFKFLNCQWLPIGTSDPQPPCIVYTHPDCPNSGGYWMRQGVSFRKVKITNNKENPKSNVLLHSMHKYYVRLVIEEHKKGSSSSANPPKTVLVQDFPETTFITVTAYQNEEVTQLKISNNPFAKAFREGAGQYDWETLQLIYGPQAHFRGSEHSPITIGSCPSITSPVLPPMSMPPHGIPHLPSPAWCATPHPMTGHHHYPGGYSSVQISPSYSPYQPHPTTFDWPSHSAGPILSPRGNPPPVHPSTGTIFIPDQHGKMAASMFPALQQQQQLISTAASQQNTIPESWKTNTP